MDWFAIFLYLFALGIVGFLPLYPLKDFGIKFFRIHVTIALVCVVIATVIGKPVFGGLPSNPIGIAADVSLLAFGVTILILSLVVSAVRTKLPRDALWVPVSTGLPAVIFFAFVTWSAAGFGMRAMLSGHLLLHGAVVGSALMAMNVGHSYLNNNALSFGHLVRSCRILVWVLVAQIVVSGVFFAMHYGAWGPVLFEFDGMIAGTRALTLLLCLGMSIMSLVCAKAKSNQSATGILYVVVLFSIVSEMISTYYTIQQGMTI